MEVRIPEVGESIREALLAKWFKKNGEQVQKDEPLCEIETDKITLDINADASGQLTILSPEGTTVPIGAIVGIIADQPETDRTNTEGVGSVAASGMFASAEAATSPAVRRELRERGLTAATVNGSGKGGRITLDDLMSHSSTTSVAPPAPESSGPASVSPASPRIAPPAPSSTPPVSPRQEPLFSSISPVVAPQSVNSETSPSNQAEREVRKPMTPIRRTISERLVAARQQTAMLTTFNEVDMTNVADLRAANRERYKTAYGVSLGLMPFFIKASVKALRTYPSANAFIEGSDFVFHNYYNIGVAIGSDKGLVVPVLRDADTQKDYDIDRAIREFKRKIDTFQISISELTGGTFTISNGGVYGSMLSTPILNPPQSAVLGMHAIQDRPVVRNGQIVIRPMMYLALSYDHRVLDGREAVGFLGVIKDFIENAGSTDVDG